MDKVVAIESRGFILGGVLASRLGRRLRPGPQARKAPARRPCRASYELEYGTDTLEIHEDALDRASGC